MVDIIMQDRVAKAFIEVERQLLQGAPQIGMVTSIESGGIGFKWVKRSKRDGGLLKRKSEYGDIHYYDTYTGRVLSRDEAIKEAMKPPDLRQALKEAISSIECSICGKVVVGLEALDAHQSWAFRNGQFINKQQWGCMFYKMDGNEPIMLEICPDCMASIANGEFKNNTQQVDE